MRIRSCRNAELDVFQSFRTRLRHGGAHSVIPRIGSAYKPKGYSSHPPNPLSILLIFCRDNHYRCPLLNESRTTTAVRTTSNVGACPVVPPTRAVTNKVNRLLTLSRVCSEELDFCTTGYLSATNSTRPAAHRWNTPDLSFRYDTLRRHHWVTRLLTCKNKCCS